jgi:2-polyprenyl-3-methyl-5-hydroxy-6-metoxy-1,4-benzoquinol methylase
MGDTSIGRVDEKLDVLKQLSEFEYGRFLLCNRGSNGRWAHYWTYEFRNRPQSSFHPFEYKYLTSYRSKGLRERLDITWSVIQPELRDNMILASAPCGTMAELLGLDYSGVKNFKIVGIDLDSNSAEHSRAFARQRGLIDHTTYIQSDLWKIDDVEKFDFIVCLGFSPYVKDSEKLLEIYKIFRRALKKGGKLITESRISDYETMPGRTPVTAEDVRFETLVFVEVLQGKFSRCCSSGEFLNRLRDAGFSKVEGRFNQYNSLCVGIGTA